jgi:hypothetical protein
MKYAKNDDQKQAATGIIEKLPGSFKHFAQEPETQPE